MIEFARVAALIGVLGTAVVFGTDVFCAMVQRPALAHVDDRALVAVMGYVHRYGDRRMPIPSVIGVGRHGGERRVRGCGGQAAVAIMAAAALALLLVRLTLYLRVSAPINKQLTAAAQSAMCLRILASCKRIRTARPMRGRHCRASRSARCASP